MASYIAVIHKEDGSEFGVSFPDFPGCVAAGPTLEEARRQAQEALELHMEGMLEDGEELPVPSDLDAVARHPSYADASAICVVDAKELARTERINCTFRSDVLRQIDAAVERLGTTRSAFLAAAALDRLRRGEGDSGE